MLCTLLLILLGTVRPKEISLGVLVTWQGGNWKHSESILGILPALKEINDNPDILPNDTLTFAWADSQCDPRFAADAAAGLLEMKVDGIIGAPCSVSCLPIGLFTNYYNVPMISYFAVHPDLSNKDTYPYFARVVDSTKVYDKTLIAFLKKLGFKHAAMVYPIDSRFSLGWASTLRKSLHNAGFYIDADIPYKSFGNLELRLLRRTGARVFLWLDYSCTRVRELLTFASENNILEGWTWVFEVVSKTCWQEAETYEDQIKSLYTFNGLFSICSSYKLSQHAKNVLDAAKPDIESLLLPFSGTSTKVPARGLNPHGFNYSMDDIAMSNDGSALVYDAIILYALAAHAVQSQGGSINDAQAMHEAMVNTSFQGFTGDVAFNENGDRLGSASIEEVTVNSSGNALITRTVFSYHGDTDIFDFPFPEESLVFAGGIQKKPPDHVKVCQAGHYSPNISREECFRCEAGKFANGTAYDRRTCYLCSAGRFQRTMGQTECEACYKGRFASEEGSHKCQECTLGKYADSTAMTMCANCSSSHHSPGNWTTMQKIAELDEWIYFTGARDYESCGCDKGLRFDEQGECVQCGEGVSCQGMGEVEILAGYHSELPVSVYHCFGDKRRCPGGPPGHTCAAGREGLSCSECEAFKRPMPDGTCTQCEDSDYLPFIIACISGVAVVSIIYCIFSGRRSRTQKHNLLILAAISGGQIFTSLQQLGVIGMIAVDFEEPIKTCIELLNFFAFEIEFIRLPCVGTVSSTVRFMMVSLIFFALMVLVSVIHLIAVLVFHKGRFGEPYPSYVASMGVTCLMCFIPVISTVIKPMNCSLHPNGRWSVQAYQDVLCWSAEEASNQHMTMVIFGLCCLTFPFGFVAWVIHKSLQLPQRVSAGDVKFLDTFGFLFFRFKSGAHWYINVLLIRSASIAIIPVMPNVILQVFFSDACIKLYVFAVIYFKPWRVPLANVIDIACCVILMMWVNVASFYVEGESMKGLLWFYTICLVSLISILLMMLVFAAYVVLGRKRKPYQIFVCHHKARAGAFARLLKSMLLESSKMRGQVFLDSDDLCDLTQLFQLVANDVENLVIIGTKDVFLRPWCAGEMTTARQAGIKVTILAMPDWQPPDEATIRNFGTLVDMKALIENHITLQEVQITLEWLCTLPVITLPREVSLPIMQSLVSDLASGVQDGVILKSPSEKASERLSAILVDSQDMEAVSSAHFLAHLMLPQTMHIPKYAPTVVLACEELPSDCQKFIVICSGRCFEQSHFLQLLAKAMNASEVDQALPVVVDSNFSFPSDSFLMDLCRQPSKVEGQTSDQLADMIRNLFKEIAVVFQPQHAPAAVLQVNAQMVADRILPVNLIGRSSLRDFAANFITPRESTKQINDVESRETKKQISVGCSEGVQSQEKTDMHYLAAIFKGGRPPTKSDASSKSSEEINDVESQETENQICVGCSEDVQSQKIKDMHYQGTGDIYEGKRYLTL